MGRWIVGVVLVAAACGDKAAKPKGWHPPQESSIVAGGSGSRDAGADAVVEDCEARVARLEARLARLVAARPGAVPVVMPPIDLPSAKVSRPVTAWSAVLVATPDASFSVDGGDFVPLAGAREHLDSLGKAMREAAVVGSGARPPWPLYVWADRRVTLGALAEVMQELDDWELRLLVAQASASTEDDRDFLARPAVAKLVRELPTSTDAAALWISQEWRRSTGACAGLPMAFVGDGGRTSWPAVAKAAPAAVRACKCDLADADAFEYVTLAWFGAFQPTPAWVPLNPVSPKSTRTVADVAATYQKH